MINGRTKGHNFERQMAREWRDMGFKEAQTKRQARGGDWSKEDNGEDLVGTGEFTVQLKCLHNYCSPAVMKQIKKETGIPLILTKANNKEIMAIIPWKHLKPLLHPL